MEEGRQPGRHIARDGAGSRFKLATVTLEVDPLAQLKVAEEAIARLEAERGRLESIVVRLGALAAEFDAEGIVQGVTEAARDLAGATLAMFVPTEMAALDQPTVVCEPGALGELPEPSRVPILAGALWRVTPVRLDDALQLDAGNTGYGRSSDGKPFRSWVGAPGTGPLWRRAEAAFFWPINGPRLLERRKRKWPKPWPPTLGPASITWPFSRSDRASPGLCSRPSCLQSSPKCRG